MNIVNLCTKLKKRYGITSILLVLLVAMYAGCASGDANPKPSSDTTENIVYTDEEMTDAVNIQTDTNMEKDKEDSTSVSSIHNFEQDEVLIAPEILEYSFEEAVKIGEVQELDGVLPGADLGTWYTVTIEGVEYYYGRYGEIPSYYSKYDIAWEEYQLFGWSIVNDTYELANGIKIGMKEENILEQYPDMAVIDFEDNSIYGIDYGFMGWNGIAYPRSYEGMDSNWDYQGNDYYKWTDQFDYIMVADINFNTIDILPQYLGLLIKDNTVAAITFYYPTAG